MIRKTKPRAKSWNLLLDSFTWPLFPILFKQHVITTFAIYFTGTILKKQRCTNILNKYSFTKDNCEKCTVFEVVTLIWCAGIRYTSQKWDASKELNILNKFITTSSETIKQSTIKWQVEVYCLMLSKVVKVMTSEFYGYEAQWTPLRNVYCS